MTQWRKIFADQQVIVEAGIGGNTLSITIYSIKLDDQVISRRLWAGAFGLKEKPGAGRPSSAGTSTWIRVSKTGWSNAFVVSCQFISRFSFLFG